MVRTFLASAALLVASAGLAFGATADQFAAGCACCAQCKCESCDCEALGCACDVGGDCYCDGACGAACCDK